MINPDEENNLKESMKSNIGKYYLFSFISVFVLYTPFIIYYFQNLGLSLTNIATLFSVAVITTLILEIPSGYFADKFGRKRAILIAVLLALVAITTIYLATGYYLLLIAHVFLGAGAAFISGAHSALIYDTLLTLKREKEYKKIEGKAVFLSGISGIIACLTASLVVIFGISYTILLSIFVFILLLFVVLSFTEPTLHKQLSEITIENEFKNFKSVIAKALHNKKLLYLFIYALVVMGIADTIFINYQPYFRAVSIPIIFFGVIFAIFSVVHGLVALKADYIERKIGVFGSLLLMPILLIGALLGAGMLFVWFGIAFFLLREAARGFFFPVIGDYINKITASQERATVLSIQNMFSGVGFAVILLLFGIFNDAYGLRLGYIVMGLILIGFTIITLLILIKLNKHLTCSEKK